MRVEDRIQEEAMTRPRRIWKMWLSVYTNHQRLDPANRFALTCYQLCNIYLDFRALILLGLTLQPSKFFSRRVTLTLNSHHRTHVRTYTFFYTQCEHRNLIKYEHTVFHSIRTHTYFILIIQARPSSTFLVTADDWPHKTRVLCRNRCNWWADSG